MSTEPITIVAGLPRSGTSMMMQLLVAGGIPPLTDHQRRPDEDNPKGYYELEAVKKIKEDASFLEEAHGKVFKMVHLLLLDLPLDREYRVVFTRRKIEEVLASQKKMLERMGKGYGNLPDEKLSEIFEAQVAKVQAYLAEHPNFSVLYVNYNQILIEPKPIIDSINAFLGGTLDTDAMMAVVDPKLYRQRSGPA
ncbi:MAG TPA: sulfotransferase family protein [Verrucomicrobia bacterium]|jgi:hypothetical protein|nr:sulfotransferase family protein [Verrucomicrobiota bacterium]